MRSLPSIVTFEISHVSPDDHFAALQIDLCVRGWIEGLGRNRRLHHSHQFPNYVRSIREISHTLPERTPFIILLPLSKNKRRGNFRNGNKILQLGTDIIEALAKPCKFGRGSVLAAHDSPPYGQRGRCPPGFCKCLYNICSHNFHSQTFPP